MKRPSAFATGRRILVSMALVAAVTGCGTSADAVLDAIPTTTAAPAPVTTPPTTATDTTVPATPPPPTTSRSGSATTSGGSGSLPAEAKDAFMASCTEGAQDEAACLCVWDVLEDELDVESLIEAGSSDTLPEGMEETIVQATLSCMLSADS